ncbi:glycosyltransferase [Rossellomorea sp. NS-SX7]|uniref:glycosyltransferase n=1 Tax=Rossellomorea sp. NS-SX7 TaxID=3463856 RepID=UPI00405945F7
MKRITLFFQSFHSGGVEQILINLANELSKKYEVTALAMSSEGPLMSDLNDDIQIVNLNKKKASKTIGSLVKYIKENNPDIILSAKHFMNISVLMANLLTGKKTNVISTVHGQLGNSKKDEFMKYFIRLLYPLSDEIVCVSSGVASEIKELIPSRHVKMVNVIYNPVIDRKFIERAEEAMNAQIGKSSEEKWIVSIGRLSKEKNIDMLIQAFSKLPDKRQCKLVIIGEGPEREKLSSLVFKLGLEKEVIFKGYQKNPFIYLNRADVLALSSEREGLPTVLIEALYFNVPIVSTDCKSGPREILKGGKYGLLVPVKDTDEMATAIETQLKGNQRNPFDADVLKPYTLEEVMINYNELIEGVGN